MCRHVISSNQRHSPRKDNSLRRQWHKNILTTSERQRVVSSNISILSGIYWQLIMVHKVILLKYLKDKIFLIYEQRKHQCYGVIKTRLGLCCTVHFYVLMYTMCEYYWSEHRTLWDTKTNCYIM